MSRRRSTDDLQMRLELGGDVPASVLQARAYRSDIGLPESLSSPQIVSKLRAALRGSCRNRTRASLQASRTSQGDIGRVRPMDLRDAASPSTPGHYKARPYVDGEPGAAMSLLSLADIEKRRKVLLGSPDGDEFFVASEEVIEGEVVLVPTTDPNEDEWRVARGDDDSLEFLKRLPWNSPDGLWGTIATALVMSESEAKALATRLENSRPMHLTP